MPLGLSLTLQITGKIILAVGPLWVLGGVGRDGDHSQQVQKLSSSSSREPPQPRVGGSLGEAENRAGHRPRALFPGEQGENPRTLQGRSRGECGKEAKSRQLLALPGATASTGLHTPQEAGTRPQQDLSAIRTLIRITFWMRQPQEGSIASLKLITDRALSLPHLTEPHLAKLGKNGSHFQP